MLGGVTDTALRTLNKIVAIRCLLDETMERMRRDAGPIYSRELAELIFGRPSCRIAHVVEAGLARGCLVDGSMAIAAPQPRAMLDCPRLGGGAAIVQALRSGGRCAGGPGVGPSALEACGG